MCFDTNYQLLNSQGYGAIAVGMKGIFNASFFNNQSLSTAGELFLEKATLTIEHCTFQKSGHSIGTALTLIQSSASSSEYLQVHILNSKFTNSRSLYHGPLISFQYSPYAYMSLLLHNVTISNTENLCEYDFSLIELFDDSLSSHNFINSVAKHQVKFRHCLISYDEAANIIKHSKSLPLDMHLIMDNYIFSSKKPGNSIVLIEDCLLVSIKNSKYLHNTITCFR